MTMLTTRPIRIFADAHIFDQAPQGSLTCMKQIYSRLALDDRFRIILAAKEIDNLKAAFGDPSSLEFIAYSTGSRWKRLLSDVPRLIKKHKADLAHFQYIPPLNSPCPVLVTLHDILYEEYPEQFSLSYRLSKKILFSHGVRKADQLITVSDFSARAIQKKWPSASHKLHTIPNGVDDRYFEDYDREKLNEAVKHRFGLSEHILFVSRREKRKGHLDLLNAWIALEAWKTHPLVFVGSKSENLPAFEERLAGLEERQRKQVHILEKLSADDLLLLYRTARLFVYPSYAEGFGLPPLEAAAVGTPVICSNRSAMSEFDFFEKGRFDPAQKQALEGTLQRFLQDPPHPDTIRSIRNSIRERYSWDRAAEQHAAVMIKMAGAAK